MFLPIKTDRPQRHAPIVNYAIIAVNAFIFAATHDKLETREVQRWFLSSHAPELLQFLSYQFLHADLAHVGFNMLFLYVFGNSVEDRLGKIGYLCFYLAGGISAGLGHALFSDNPVLGASGSVSAVTGAYLVLFPRSRILVVYWFYFFGAREISSLWIILFQIGQNVFMQLMPATGVAYMAHLAGYAFGAVIAMALLFTRLLPREPYDLLSMWTQYRRRSEFKRLTTDGYSPWSGNAPSPQTPAVSKNSRLYKDERKAGRTDDLKEERITQTRVAVNQSLTDHNAAKAAREYCRLLDLDPAQVLSEKRQVEIGNQLMADGKHEYAARAYELYLNTFGKTADRPQVELLLALCYTRYLGRKQRARELLTSAQERLTDAGHKAMATQLLSEID